MIKPRTIFLGGMLTLPVLVYCGFGLYAIWQVGLFKWIWWLMPVCWLLTWIVAKLWKPSANAEVDSLQPLGHWTDRDKLATEIVQTYQKRVASLPMSQLADPHFLLDEMKSMASDLSQHYHPDSKSPINSLTLPEVLSAARLAITDMERWALESTPGSRLLTIGQWKSLRHAPKLVQNLQKFGWAASVLLNPANLGLYISSKYSIQPVTKELTQNLSMLLYARFVRQVGFYLIEMNSGRLRAGADDYLRTFGSQSEVSSSRVQGNSEETAEPELQTPRTVVVSLVGQVSSGKSSLVNALTGSDEARVDVLPTTKSVSRYRLAANQTADDAEVILLDTPGYGEAGATRRQLKEIEAALLESDAVLLLIDGHSPAREPDCKTLAGLTEWYAQNPRLKKPPILGVVTHVDLLPPALDWQPPIDWTSPSSEKEKQIAEAIEYAHEALAGQLAACVPACLAAEADRRWGVVEEIIPALTELVDSAKAVAIVRGFEKQLDANRAKLLLKQITKLASNVAVGFRDSN